MNQLPVPSSLFFLHLTKVSFAWNIQWNVKLGVINKIQGGSGQTNWNKSISGYLFEDWKVRMSWGSFEKIRSHQQEKFQRSVWIFTCWWCLLFPPQYLWQKHITINTICRNYAQHIGERKDWLILNQSLVNYLHLHVRHSDRRSSVLKQEQYL